MSKCTHIKKMPLNFGVIQNMKVLYCPFNSPRSCLDSQTQSIQGYQVLKMGDCQGALEDGHALSIMSIQGKLAEEKKDKEYFRVRKGKQFSGILPAFECLTCAPSPFPHPSPPHSPSSLYHFW